MDDPGYSLVMPFVVCQSNGGPFEDEAFVAGYICGSLDAELAAGGGASPRWLLQAVLPQAELIAMRYGCIIEQLPDPGTIGMGEYVNVRFVRV